MKTNIGISAKSRSAVAAILATVLADETVLYTKTRNFHWNVKGPRFHDLHLFFEELYTGSEQTRDDIAERIRALGLAAPGSLKQLLQLTRMEEEDSTDLTADKMIKILLKDQETFIRNLRADIAVIEDDHEDVGTADFLTGLLAAHEKSAWMLRSAAEA
ncbi:Dps family protein [Synoicihabitans lomoniglobus]|uniref:DNA starvation/stationary phase protection protein n=1 Tax=Synoicihabitans lomoniglobus TaxID=2909285 RepID=A0AAF0CRF8_9BACT|nr:DNA starvation/stationary phase protection protein [Opitutaceae bacterium LMO-M01]WED66678.1 DNA starvation/stationary phase protection protein [Opitutaceae bacterium LMO-M01]